MALLYWAFARVWYVMRTLVHTDRQNQNDCQAFTSRESYFTELETIMFKASKNLLLYVYKGTPSKWEFDTIMEIM